MAKVNEMVVDGKGDVYRIVRITEGFYGEDIYNTIPKGVKREDADYFIVFNEDEVEVVSDVKSRV